MSAFWTGHPVTMNMGTVVKDYIEEAVMTGMNGVPVSLRCLDQERSRERGRRTVGVAVQQVCASEPSAAGLEERRPRDELPAGALPGAVRRHRVQRPHHADSVDAEREAEHRRTPAQLSRAVEYFAQRARRSSAARASFTTGVSSGSALRQTPATVS